LQYLEFLVSAIIAESSTDLWLLRQLDTKQARIAVIGLGYVGLPLAVGFARAGFRVFGIDNDNSKIDSLRNGQSYIGDVSSFSLEPLVKKETFQPTTDASALAEADVIIICVPTPLRKTKEPDISYILAAAGKVKENLRAGQLIVLESTTYPGTTEEVVLPMLEETGFRIDEDFLLAFSPERVDPGNRQFDTSNIPKVVGGVTALSTKVAAHATGRSSVACILSHPLEWQKPLSFWKIHSVQSISVWSTKLPDCAERWTLTPGKSLRPPQPSHSGLCRFIQALDLAGTASRLTHITCRGRRVYRVLKPGLSIWQKKSIRRCLISWCSLREMRSMIAVSPSKDLES